MDTELIIKLIAWGLIQACVALLIPPFAVHVLKIFLMEYEPGLLFTVIVGAMLACLFGPVYFIGVGLGVVFFFLIIRLIAQKLP